MNDYVIITINGVNYYCPANYVQYITENGVNTYSNNITLYGSLREYNNQNSGYPQITLQSYGYATYRGSYNGTISQINISSVEFNNQAKLLRSQVQKDYFNSFLIVLLCVFVIFRRS